MSSTRPRRSGSPTPSRRSTGSCSTSGISTSFTTSLFVRPAFAIGRLFWKGGDGAIIDGFGPDGVSARVLDVTRSAVRLQSGYIYQYAFAMLLGVAALATWYLFGGGR